MKARISQLHQRAKAYAAMATWKSGVVVAAIVFCVIVLYMGPLSGSGSNKNGVSSRPESEAQGTSPQVSYVETHWKEQDHMDRLEGIEPLNMQRKQLTRSCISFAKRAPTPSSGLGQLPVRRCGRDSHLLKTWMNPIYWNDTFPSNLQPQPDGPVFVMGCGHSGTTLAVTLIAKHPAFKHINDHTLNKEIDLCQRGSYLRKHKAVWDGKTADEGKDRWVAKAPSNICCLGRILREFPNGRAVFMVRDGRDVLRSFAKRYKPIPKSNYRDFASWLYRQFGSYYDRNPHSLLDRWVLDNLMGLYFAQDPRVLLMRYEDLIHHPMEELARLFKFLGAEADDRLIAKIAGTDKDGDLPDEPDSPFGHKDGKSHDKLRDWQVHQGLFDDTQRWMKEGLTPILRRAFATSELARGLLQEFGYEPSADMSW